MKRRNVLRVCVDAALFGLVLLAFGLPLFWTLLGSLRPETLLFTAPSFSGLSFEHYGKVLFERELWVPLKNSLIVASFTTLFCLSLGAPTAYALARLRFRAKRLLAVFFLMISMFPQVSIVAPLFLLLRQLGLIDTYPGLVLPYLTFSMPLTVWLLTSYFRELPREVEQAALLDGASQLRVLWYVLLPMARPGLLSAALVTFLYSYNEFLFALSFTVGPEHQTLPVAIAMFQGQYRMPWGEILAATVVAMGPVICLVLLFQQRLIKGFGAPTRHLK